MKSGIKVLRHKIIRHKNSIMKTSIKLLITALLIIIGSMITYDLALRAEYRKGTYKSRFYEFEKTTDAKMFTTLDNRAANLVTVRVEQGEHFGIWMMKDLKDYISISHKGTVLVIDVIDKKSPYIKPYINIYKNRIIITCPAVNKIITTPFFASKENEEGNYSIGNTSLVGFSQQELELHINKATRLDLDKNKIDFLKAYVGDSSTQHANLTIRSNDQINNAEIKVEGKNELNLENPKITKSNFNISDSAQVNLSGSFLNQIKKEQQ